MVVTGTRPTTRTDGGADARRTIGGAARSLLTRSVAGLAIAAATVACGSADAPDAGPARNVRLEASEFAFAADEAITIRAGDRIEFEVRNVGDLDHQLEVLDASNRVLGRTERIAPGAVRSTTVTFEQAGVYQVICDIDDHRSRGQNAQFDVAG